MIFPFLKIQFLWQQKKLTSKGLLWDLNLQPTAIITINHYTEKFSMAFSHAWPVVIELIHLTKPIQ